MSKGETDGIVKRPVNPKLIERLVAMGDDFPPVGPPPEPDMVSEPPHYRQGSIECIDALQAALTPEEFRGALKANVLKYVWRERHKGGVESLRKAAWYLDRLIKASS